MAEQNKNQDSPKEEQRIQIETLEEVSREKSGEKAGLFKYRLALFSPNVRDMAIFCRQLATLLDVGIPLLRSLQILSQRTQHPRLKKVVGKVAQRVEEGQTFSSSLALFPNVFSPLFINVVRVGEVGGILESSLKRLADILEKKSDIKKKIFSAIAYPIVSLCVAVAVIVVILTVAIPRFIEVYEGQKAELPDITKIIIALSDFVRLYPYIYIPLIVIAIVALFLYGKTPMGKWTYDTIRLYTPIIGSINVKINVARFTRTVGGLLSAGIPLLEALNLAAQTSENLVIGNALNKTYQTVEQGGKMDEPLRKSPVFPPLVVDMIAIGDEAGALDVMLNKIADAYETDVDASLKALTAVIEPALIVFMGFVVIFIALGVLLPYFNLVHVIGE